MKKKHLFFTAASAFVLCAALLISGVTRTPVEAATEKDVGEAGVILYEHGDKDFKVPERKANSTPDVLDANNKEPLDYSKAYVKEYSSDDTRLDKLLEGIKMERQVLSAEKGDNIPAEYWNLEDNPYEFEVYYMTNYVYTNKYFNVDPDGCIAMDFGTLDSNGEKIRIICYETVTNTAVRSTDVNPEQYAGVGFCGLSTDKTYYFKFEINQASILTGVGHIMHDYNY